MRPKSQWPSGTATRGYSSIEHLALCCRGAGFDWKEVTFGVFTACFDASGSKDHPWMTVAGFVAPAKAWECFAKLWNQRLSKDGFTYFHMKEFSVSAGEFRKWKGEEHESERRALLADLIELIKSHASRKFGHAVAMEGVEHVRTALARDQQKKFMLEAYVIAGYLCAKRVHEWARRERTHTPECVFDDGDLDRQKLRDLFKIEGWPEPIFRPSRDISKRGILNHGFIPLQSADLLANELYQVCPQIPDVDMDKLRWPLQQFRNMPEEPTYIGRNGYERIRRGLENMIPGLAEFEGKLSRKS